jgi:hypothetical protein
MAIEPTIGEIFQLEPGPVKTVRVPEPRRGISRWHLLWFIPATLIVVASVGSPTNTRSAAPITSTHVANKPWEGCDRGLDVIKQDVSNGLELFGKGFTHFLSPDGSKSFEAGVIANQQSIADAREYLKHPECAEGKTKNWLGYVHHVAEE